MIAALADAVVEYLRSEMGTGELLEGVASVDLGPVEPEAIPDAHFPAVRVTYGEIPVLSPQFGRVDIGGTLIIALYTRSSKAYGVAQAQCARLVWSDDRARGLLVALAKKRGYQVAGDSVAAKPGPVSFSFGPSKGYTFAASIPVALQSMVTLP